MILPRAVAIHGLAHAKAALAPGRPVLLLSAPGAAGFAGAGWWRALIAAALDGGAPGLGPDALDCGNQPGRALEALAAGCRIIILRPCPAFAAVAGRAASAIVLPERPPALDLAQPGALRQLDAWLQGDKNAPIG
jgi:hypothetical protein